ncbi:hypothetical protein E1180_11390 [Roseibium denhamense]|uniref:Uncharacterized protein n=1 Tax=Roseibium denhamense TaxID=76305 RepID=A0ABY1N5W3_9HYPH|nr:hypothetical protein [Roseibium denhamense]MTI06116.1 hypothetical protein [Roseibium denhamense]SMP01088.1 hypothetical protein SAMN06265374_0315 [Roseibium denhamense]
MNRPKQILDDYLPDLLAKAGSTAERAARAMTPNGDQNALARAWQGYVITLHTSACEGVSAEDSSCNTSTTDCCLDSQLVRAERASGEADHGK